MKEYMYKEYCEHNQPIYYQKFCSGCKEIKEREAKIRYDSYWKKKRGCFWDYFKETFGGDVTDPSYKHEIPKEFNTLRRSTSAEELKKEYRKLCRIHHPDKGGKTTMFQRLQNLYERLCSSF